MAGSLRCGNSRGRGVYGWKGLRSQSVTEDEIVNYSDEPIDRRLEISHLSMVHGTVFFQRFFGIFGIFLFPVTKTFGLLD